MATITIKENHPDGTSHGISVIIMKSSLVYNQIQNINKSYIRVQAANIKIKINHLNVTNATAYFHTSQQITEPKLQ